MFINKAQPTMMKKNIPGIYEAFKKYREDLDEKEKNENK